VGEGILYTDAAFFYSNCVKCLKCKKNNFVFGFWGFFPASSYICFRFAFSFPSFLSSQFSFLVSSCTPFCFCFCFCFFFLFRFFLNLFFYFCCRFCLFLFFALFLFHFVLFLFYFCLLLVFVLFFLFWFLILFI
jgi:hypothetical protein